MSGRVRAAFMNRRVNARLFPFERSDFSPTGRGTETNSRNTSLCRGCVVSLLPNILLPMPVICAILAKLLYHTCTILNENFPYYAHKKILIGISTEPKRNQGKIRTKNLRPELNPWWTMSHIKGKYHCTIRNVSELPC